MKFRQHRNTLEESMEPIQEVQSLMEIKSISEAMREGMELETSVGRLTYRHYCYDHRTKWET